MVKKKVMQVIIFRTCDILGGILASLNEICTATVNGGKVCIGASMQ